MKILLISVILNFLLFSLYQCNTYSDNPVYFLVAEHKSIIGGHGDSYILPITNVNDIEMARNMIRNEIPSLIVCAYIKKGSGNGNYKNKDLLKNRTWSWYVTEFIGFAEIIIEILDGWPEFVESDIDGWIENTGGEIGFWAYSVNREVDIIEIQ